MIELRVMLRTLADTQKLAQRIHCCLPQPKVIALIGNLGSGKTTFTQVFGELLGVTEPLTSPTFTLVNEYHVEGRVFAHADLYRLHDVAEIREIGLTDYFAQPNAVTVVEWADRAMDMFPSGTVWMTLELEGDHRVARIRCENPDFWHCLKEAHV